VLVEDFLHSQGDDDFMSAFELVINARPHLCPLPRGEDFTNHVPSGLINSNQFPARKFIVCEPTVETVGYFLAATPRPGNLAKKNWTKTPAADPEASIHK
jgi:hypothetical protein